MLAVSRLSRAIAVQNLLKEFIRFRPLQLFLGRRPALVWRDAIVRNDEAVGSIPTSSAKVWLNIFNRFNRVAFDCTPSGRRPSAGPYPAFDGETEGSGLPGRPVADCLIRRLANSNFNPAVVGSTAAGGIRFQG